MTRFKDIRQTFFKGFVKNDYPEELQAIFFGDPEKRPKIDATPRLLSMPVLGWGPALNRASKRKKTKPERESKSNNKHYTQSQILAQRKVERLAALESGVIVSKYRKGRGTYHPYNLDG